MSRSIDEHFELVLAEPDQDAPRLAYACELHGEKEHAEFIRAALAAAAQFRAGRRDWATYNTADVLQRNRERWAGRIGSEVSHYQYFRGFVELIRVDAKEFLDRAPHLYRLAPIRRLVLTGVLPVLEAVLDSPYLDRIVTLSFYRQGLGDRQVELIAASLHLRKLASLDLTFNAVTLGGVELLAASNNVPALRELRLAGNPAESAGEDLWVDQGQIINTEARSDDRAMIEAKYGRKTWLHTVEDHGLRQVWEDEY